MLNPRKQYDPVLAEWSKSAELSISRFFELIGYSVIKHPHGIYGKDVECKSDTEHFYVEVERRTSMTWREGNFPYTAVNVPERRVKSIDLSTMLFIVRYDLALALVVFAKDILEAAVEKSSNRYVRGEGMCQVDRKRCLPLDLLNTDDKRSIAERSRENILSQWSMHCGNYLLKREVLGKSEPYGMSYSEWTRLLTETDRLLEPMLGLAYSSETFLKRTIKGYQ